MGDAYISPARSFRITSSLSTSKPLSSHLHPSQRTFTSTSNNMGADSLIQGFKARRTHYALKPESPMSDDKIHEIVEQAILHTPSSFNSQSTRVLVLLADQHKKLWEEIVKPAVKAVAPPEAWESSEKRLSGFSNAYGTILFYEDPNDISKLQESYALYADRFPQWSEHTNAMHQYALWTLLEQEGFGANLQHYNPLIDEKVASEWGIPNKWSLKSQLVFGAPAGAAGEKSFKPVDGERLFIYGGKFGTKS